MFSGRRCKSRHFSGVHCDKMYGHTGPHGSVTHAMNWNDNALIHNGITPDYEINNPIIQRRKVVTTNPIKSWRWWKIGRRGILTSITSEHEWRGPVATTKSYTDPETGEKKLARVTQDNPIHRSLKTMSLVNTPFFDWGVFSYKTPALFREHNSDLINHANSPLGDPLTLERIENYGQIIEHEFGYRSQKVIMRELFVFSPGDTEFRTGWLRATERRYECPVKIIKAKEINSWIDYYSDEAEQ